jgi:tetratricopeptide (TPR) repeat protein
MSGGGYQLGFQITPLTSEGGLDEAGDFKGGPHPAQEDNLFKMACENRDGGNKMVQMGQHEAAIARYSEQIMQLRSLENETDILWDDAGHEAVHQLRASAYLNLSLCFLKTQQWTHASNTATRAMQGDKDPPDPKQDVLAPEKKAKALFRRAQAQSEGFGNFEKAKEDLQKALELAPEDKAVQQELRRIQQSLSKSNKEADKKMAGFLSGSKKVQSGEGIFDDKLRPSDKPSQPEKLPDVCKLKDGLWVVPKDEKQEKAEAAHSGEDDEDKVDYDELTREINEMREDRPEVYNELREKVKSHLEEAAKQEPEQAAVGAESAPVAGA